VNQKQESPISAPMFPRPFILPFLELPAEMRYYIYELCTPVQGYTEDYYGLLASCRQIHVEFAGVAVRSFAGLLTTVQKEWPYTGDLRFETPTKFHKLRELTLGIPASIYSREAYRESILDLHRIPHLDVSIIALLSLHLSKLILTFYEDEVFPEGMDGLGASPCSIINDLDIILHGPSASEQDSSASEQGSLASAQGSPGNFDKRQQTHRGQDIHVRTRTKQLIVKWTTAATTEEAKDWCSHHFEECRIMKRFAERDVVTSFVNDPQGLLVFEFETERIGSKVKVDHELVVRTSQ
jgi:hypothetical protein